MANDRGRQFTLNVELWELLLLVAYRGCNQQQFILSVLSNLAKCRLSFQSLTSMVTTFSKRDAFQFIWRFHMNFNKEVSYQTFASFSYQLIQ